MKDSEIKQNREDIKTPQLVMNSNDKLLYTFYNLWYHQIRLR